MAPTRLLSGMLLIECKGDRDTMLAGLSILGSLNTSLKFQLDGNLYSYFSVHIKCLPPQKRIRLYSLYLLAVCIKQMLSKCPASDAFLITTAST